jgi:hypothetical protein
MVPFRTPFSVKQLRPLVVLDTEGSNATTLDYSEAKATVKRDVKCFFQMQSGKAFQQKEGNLFTFDALMWTHESDIKVNDKIEFVSAQLTSNFIVAGVEVKYNIDGKFNHVKVTLTRELRV